MSYRMIFSRSSSSIRIALLAVTLVLFAGCTRMGPQLTVRDHVQYASAIGESWKTEVLANIVRLRYGDWPLFTKVDTAVTNYTLQHQVVGGGVLRSPWSGKDNLQLFYTGKINENPRAIMTPLGGPMFVQSMLTPIPRAMTLALLQSSGWSADRALQTILFAVNGHRNLHAVWNEGWSMTIDPEFQAFVEGVHQAQMERALSIQRKRGDRNTLLACFRAERLSEEGTAALRKMREQLDLSTETDCYEVQSGNRPPNRETIVIQTRSVLALLVSLGAYVQVPAADLASGAAPKLPTIAAEVPQFLRIHSGPEPPHPDLVHTAVKHRDHWFWIEHTDADSKRTMAYLGLIMNLAEAGSGGGAQMVLNVGRQAPDDVNEESTIDEVLAEEQ